LYASSIETADLTTPLFLWSIINLAASSSATPGG
jgi:hypothetical protein